MLICTRCESHFNEPKTMVDVVIDGEGYNYSTCPYCGHDDLAEAEPCKGCDKWIEKYREYCNDCRDQIFKEMHKVWQSFDGDRGFLEVVSDWIEAQ